MAPPSALPSERFGPALVSRHRRGKHAETFSIERVGSRIRLRGELRTRDADAIWRALDRATAIRDGELTFDLSGVRLLDGGVMTLLTRVRGDLAARNVKSTLEGGDERVIEIVRLYEEPVLPTRAERPRGPRGFVVDIGRTTETVLGELKSAGTFVGSLSAEALTSLRRPWSVNWREVAPLSERMGADAVPIILLINFMVGIITALNSVSQLRMYGANIFVADIVSLGMTRELAPLITAIVVCGRSGAAIAAELGSMRVSEELDALQVMGLSPVRYLVFPRLMALVIVVPMLTIASAAVGIVGGALVAKAQLDVGYASFVHEMQTIAKPWDMVSGLIKSVAYALTIGIIACQQGFAASGGASGVGRRATSTVVATLFALMILNSGFTWIFRSMD
ncbi:MAG: MlaE family lipid ABC transporter permease subunit [Polyangiaceae bacterium]|nr:MlaE family lipid ABC transporter permease subunit [Polyangiaceae bacterium]